MSLFVRLTGVALCIAALASPIPALADAAPIDVATDSACALDRVREIVAGATQHSASETERNTLIVENTADWVPDFNAFATAPETPDLMAAADAAIAGKLSRAACKQLLPFAAVAASAEAVSRAGGAIEAGPILTPCPDGTGLCQPASTATIIGKCGFAPFALPLRSTC